MANKINELVALLNTVPAGQLTENAVQTYLNILNIEIVEKGTPTTSSTTVEPISSESTVSRATRLLAEAKQHLNQNLDKYGFVERFTRDALDTALDHMKRKEYKYA